MLLSRLVRSSENYDDPKSLGNRCRLLRIQEFMKLVRHVHARKAHVSVFDIGGTRRYWRHLISEKELNSFGLTITIVNLDNTPDINDDIHFNTIKGDGRALDYEDGTFDIVHSNSVVEHVGSWKDMLAFANEVRRLGRWYFAQTPHSGFLTSHIFYFPFFIACPSLGVWR
jgi:hypothetical protein